MMRLLLTNDDGIDARGLAVLEEMARQFGEVAVVAPQSGLSGCSHRVTSDGPIDVEHRGSERHAVAGTPADCVRLALHSLAPATEWVLSGINHGGNLGVDLHHSGTVAAVREGVLHGRPGIALSHYRRRGIAEDWSRVSRCLFPLLEDLMARPWQSDTFWNINFPSLDPHQEDPEVVFCAPERKPLPLRFHREETRFHYCGEYSKREAHPENDVGVCFSGKIAVSLISVW